MSDPADGGLPTVTRRPPEIVAALVNGALVLALPLAWITYAFLTSSVGTPSRLREAVGAALIAGALMLPLVPVALVVIWRTSVHGKRYLAHQGSGWLGVLEGGALGGAFALLVLLPATVMQPTQAPPYLIAYGGAAAIIGMVAAFVLRLTALLVLRAYR